MPARALTVILAAGEGKRMRSILPKVLHRVGGRPLVEHLVQSSLKAGLGRVIVVVGHRRDMVIEALVDYPIEIVVQADQRGTGHAMQLVAEHLGNFAGAVLIVPGDAPFLRPKTMRGLVEFQEEGGYAAGLLTAEIDDPTGYGRIVRDESGDVARIVEHGDSSPEELEIREINSSVYVFDYAGLEAALGELKASNRQGELYLTDTIAALRKAGARVGAIRVEDPVEVMGINDPAQLREAERIYRERQPAPPPPPRPQAEAPGKGEEPAGGESVEGGLAEDEAGGEPAEGELAEDEAGEGDEGGIGGGEAAGGAGGAPGEEPAGRAAEEPALGAEGEDRGPGGPGGTPNAPASEPARSGLGDGGGDA